MSFMFYGVLKFDKDISKWKVINVKDYNNFCKSFGLKCEMIEFECKIKNCLMFCCEKNK